MNRLLQYCTWKNLFIALLVIHVAPIWIFPYFPTQDGPAHVYNAKVLRDYHDTDNHEIREAYRLNLRLFPNWTSHASMTALMYIVPPMIAEKIFLTVTVALLPLSLCYLLGAIDRRHVLFSLVGFIFSHHNLLHMGFYNFALSVSLGLFTLGYWWKHRHDIHVRQIVVLNVLLVLTYVTHFGSYALLLAALALIALFDFVSGTVKHLWGQEKTEASPPQPYGGQYAHNSHRWGYTAATCCWRTSLGWSTFSVRASRSMNRCRRWNG